MDGSEDVPDRPSERPSVGRRLAAAGALLALVAAIAVVVVGLLRDPVRMVAVESSSPETDDGIHRKGRGPPGTGGQHPLHEHSSSRGRSALTGPWWTASSLPRRGSADLIRE